MDTVVESFVRVTFTNGKSRIVKAESFGEAASRVDCGKESIKFFTWEVVLR